MLAHPNLKIACLLVLVGMLFDMLDGRVARLTRSTSDLGGQLDSLSDAITFGLPPAFLVWKLIHLVPKGHDTFYYGFFMNGELREIYGTNTELVFVMEVVFKNPLFNSKVSPI